MVSFLRIIKIEVAVSIVMLCAMALLATMMLAKFNSTLAELAESRISVIVHDMRDTIEQGLALGIGLQELNNVHETIERASRRDTKISAIYVIDQKGTVLYRSPSAALDLPDVVITGWEKATLNKRLVSSQVGSVIDTVSVLKNSFSQPVGLLLVKYDARALRERQDAFLAHFLHQAFLYLLVGMALTALLAWILLRRIQRTDTRLAEMLEEADFSSTKPGKELPAGRASELMTFSRTEHEVIDALAEAEQFQVAK